MNPSPALLAIMAVVMVGGAVLWANPSRLVNRLYLSLALHVSAWLWCVHSAVEGGESPHWIRLASAIGAFIPAHLWLLKEARVDLWKGMRRKLQGADMLWFVAGAILVYLSLTRYFMQPELRDGRPDIGGGYFIYMLGVLSLYALLCRQTVLQIRTLNGLSRLELQIMLLGGSITAVAVIVLMALR